MNIRVVKTFRNSRRNMRMFRPLIGKLIQDESEGLEIGSKKKDEAR